MAAHAQTYFLSCRNVHNAETSENSLNSQIISILIKNIAIFKASLLLYLPILFSKFNLNNRHAFTSCNSIFYSEFALKVAFKQNLNELQYPVLGI